MLFIELFHGQEWWNEMPFMGRTDVFGLYRDLKFMRSPTQGEERCLLRSGGGAAAGRCVQDS